MFNQGNKDIDDCLIDIEYNLKKAKINIKRNNIEEAIYYINIAIKHCYKDRDIPDGSG